MKTINGFKYSIEPRVQYGLLTFVGKLTAGAEVIATTEAWSVEGCMNQLMAAIRKAQYAYKAD